MANIFEEGIILALGEVCPDPDMVLARNADHVVDRRDVIFDGRVISSSEEGRKHGDHDKTPLFRSAAGRTGMLTDRPMHRVDAYEMVRRRTAEAGFKVKLGCHVFRATGITAYRDAG